MIKELILKNRSYRRFYQDYKIDADVLRNLIELARISPSSANLQPLKFIISYDVFKNATIFQHLSWAGYIPDWPGPGDGEKPSAYIVILGDTEIRPSFGIDAGIAAQSILLGATEIDLGGCMIGSIKKDHLRSDLQIPSQFEILYVVALGKPKEDVVIEKCDVDGSIKYWRDENGIHHVPKRSLNELILNI